MSYMEKEIKEDLRASIEDMLIDLDINELWEVYNHVKEKVEVVPD